jgi:hypothetical protein
MTELKEADLRLLTFIKPVWCESQDGERTAVASASGRLLEEGR